MADHSDTPSQADFIGWLSLALIGVAIVFALFIFVSATMVS